MSRESDPGRLSKAAPESPLGRLLASAERDAPSDRELARLAERLAAVLDQAPVPAAVAPRSSLLTKVAVTVGVAAFFVGGLWVLRRPTTPPLAPQKPSSSPLTVVSAAPNVTGAAVAPAPSSSAAVAPAPAQRVMPQKPAPDPLKSPSAEGPSEPVLLEQARRTLASSPATALALTNQHLARFPHGLLAQEREVIAIEALRRLGRNAEADRRAAAFAQAFPGSAHQRMVEDSSPK